MYSIVELTPDLLPALFEHLALHIQENCGSGIHRFLPLNDDQSVLTDTIRLRFSEGLLKAFEDEKWRKTWIVIGKNNQVVGHADLRNYGMVNTGHRVILGMGLQQNYRGKKLGTRLLQAVIQFCKTHPRIEWIDLQVLANNIPAIRLYESLKFQKIAHVPDMFRIEDTSFDYITMTLKTNV